MNSGVMGWAKPLDIKRLRVIFVMPLGLCTAFFTGLRFNFPGGNGMI
jgi:hypothetical protein